MKPNPPDFSSLDAEALRAILRDTQDRLAESTGQLKRAESQLASRDQQLAVQSQELARREEALAAQAAELELERKKRLAVESANRIAEQEIAALKHRIFGRKSERDFSPASLIIPGLFPDAEGASDAPAGSPAPPTAPPGRRPKKQNPATRHAHGRRNLYERPADKVTTIAPDATTCVACGKALVGIGHACSRRVEWVPGHYEIHETRLEKCACPDHPSAGVVTGLSPSYVLPGAICGDGLLVRILIDKYADNIPLQRQVRRMEREGFDIAASTLCGWVQASAALLKRLVDAMLADIRNGRWCQSDATGLPVLDGLTNAPTRGQLWVYANDDHAVFRYTADGKGKNPAAELAGFTGTLVSDGINVYDLLARVEDVERAGCWSHARRKFFEARDAAPHIAAGALATLRELFLVERTLRDVSPEERLRQRQAVLKPLLAGLHRWLTKELIGLEPDNLMARAIRYTLNQWKKLCVFLHRPEIPIHNNGSELQLRNPVIGRKNWLFCGSEAGAEAAAVLFSIMGSCMLQGIDPWTYLRDVLPKIADCKVHELLELSPLKWRAARATPT
jgi:transposase